MRIVVIGGGAVGGLICNLLAEEKNVDEIICLDIRNRTFKNQKIKFEKLDISKEYNLEEFLKKTKADIAVNAVLPILNEKILDACFESKTNYLDMASFWDVDENPRAKIPYKFEQLEFNEDFKKKNLVGLFGAGVAPGITNLLAKEASTHLDNVEHIKIRLIENTGTDEPVFSWSKEWLLDEINWKPLIYENGKFKIVENFSGEEEFEFPAPYGKKKVVLLPQDEVGSIPLYIKVKNVDLKAYDTQGEFAKFLYDLGFTSEKKMNIKGVEISPIDFIAKILPDIPKNFKNKRFDNAQFLLVVQAVGKKNGKNKTITYSAVFPRQKELNKIKNGGNFISYPTAISAKLFILAIPKINRKGVFPPEAIEDSVREELIKELKKYCIFHEK